MAEIENGVAQSIPTRRLEWYVRNSVIVGFMLLLPLAAIFGLEFLADATTDARLPLARQQYQRPFRKIPRLATIEIGQQPWFQQARGDLRAVGVSYVRLERVSKRPDRYRFACQLNDAHQNRVMSREIIAYGKSPQASVEAVLAQLRAPASLSARSDSPQSAEFN